MKIISEVQFITYFCLEKGEEMWYNVWEYSSKCKKYKIQI